MFNQTKIKQSPTTMKKNRNHMKKTLLLAVAASLIGASPLMAVDLYITGSTAFRSNVHDACLKLFSPAPTEFTGTAATGGDSKTGNAAAQWTMTGTPIAGLTAISGTLTIHALFTGSTQGIQTTEQGTKLYFLDSSGNRMTNTPTIGFSDASSLVSPYPVDGVNYQEEQVAVLPFVMVRSPALAGTSVTNVTWDQYRTIIALGRLPLSSWTGKASDQGTYIYIIKRTKDSGTLRTETAEAGYAFGTGSTVYLYDVTNNLFYKGTNLLNSGTGGGTGGGASIGVVGPAGNNNANLSSIWGPGYVGGGDIGTVMKDANAANLSITYLSMSDSKSLTGATWSQVIPFCGVWPTAAGPGIAGATTNDFTPYTSGTFPLWGYEVLVYPLEDPSVLHNDQNLTHNQLGDQNTAGTILGVLDNVQSGTPLAGSLQNEIELTKTSGPATAIRISDMHATRTIVGGPIFP
jgi:hypothetical protein